MNRTAVLFGALAALFGARPALAAKPGGIVIGVFVGPNPPANPPDGQLWWDTDDGA